MIDDDTTLEDLTRGWTQQGGACCCLFCGQEYHVGDIYAFGARLVDAPAAARLHMEQTHGGVFGALLAGGKKSTGLTEAQSRVMALFYRGLPDRDIAGQLGVSAAAVRFQRFHLREKARQARVFLALSALLEAQTAGRAEEPNIHRGATMVDERYMATDEESQKIIGTFFSSLEPLRLKSLSSKEKKKLVILRVIAAQFLPGRRYTEKEVNQILGDIHEDYATLRRYLIEYGFLERTQDCGEYWVKE